jgi:hypothetical protein
LIAGNSSSGILAPPFLLISDPFGTGSFGTGFYGMDSGFGLSVFMGVPPYGNGKCSVPNQFCEVPDQSKNTQCVFQIPFTAIELRAR